MSSDNVSNDETTIADEPRIFLIPSNNLAQFEAKFAKLAKRALKIGSVVPTFSIVKEEIKTIEVEVDRIEDEFGREKVIMGDKVILIHHIVIQSPIVIVAGYEFLCAIEHTEDGNLLHVRRGTVGVVPPKYRDCKPWCDHCKTLRRRNDTFVVRKTQDNTCLQVGRNCLADFLGKDAERYAASAEIYFEIDELAEASEGSEGFGSGVGPQYDMLDSYLAYVAECITLKGWRSRSMAKDSGGAATADIAYLHLHPTREAIRSNSLLFRLPSDKSIKIAHEAISWAGNISDQETLSSDYLHNIRLIARRTVVGSRQYGYAASIVSGYMRHVGELIRKERNLQAATISQHVGEVGSRTILTLMVDKVIELPNYGFGPSSLHLMSDKLGNKFTWKSSSYTLEENTEYVLKCGIKAHEEYTPPKGGALVKQTKLTRCQKVEMKNYIMNVSGCTYDVVAMDEKDARKVLLGMLGIARMPKGVTFVEKTNVTNEG